MYIKYIIHFILLIIHFKLHVTKTPINLHVLKRFTTSFAPRCIIELPYIQHETNT